MEQQNNNFPDGQDAPPRWDFRTGARNLSNLRKNKYGHIVTGEVDDSDPGPDVTFVTNRDGTFSAKAGSVFDSPALLEWAKREYKPDAEALFTDRAVEGLSKPMTAQAPIDPVRAAEIAQAIDLEDDDDADDLTLGIESLKAEAERLSNENDESSTRIAATIIGHSVEAPPTVRRFQKSASAPQAAHYSIQPLAGGSATLAKFCPECGERFDGDEKFCPECGTQRCTYIRR